MLRKLLTAVISMAIGLAALPQLLADTRTDIQVHLDVCVMTCSPAALARTSLTGSITCQLLSAQQYAETYAAVHGHATTKVLAQPKLLAMSGTACRFNCGGQLPITQVSGTTVGVEYRHDGLELTLLPSVRTNGRIRLEMMPRIDSSGTGPSVTTAVGRVPSHDTQSMRADVEMENGQIVVAAFPGDPIQNAAKDRMTVVFVIPSVVPAPAPMPVAAVAPESQADRLKKMASMLVHEYRSACDTGDSKLASQLATMALQLDPHCFHPAMNRQGSATVLPTSVTPPMSDSFEESEAPVTPPRELLPLPLPVQKIAPEASKPSEAEILRALPNVSPTNADIVCEKISVMTKDARGVPVVDSKSGRTHWKCTVYFTDPQTKENRCEVIYIGKDSARQVDPKPQTGLKDRQRIWPDLEHLTPERVHGGIQ